MNLFDIENVKIELSELEKKTLDSDFWNDTSNSKTVLSKIKILKEKKEAYSKVEIELKNQIELTELLETEPDETMIKDLLRDTEYLQKEIEKLEINTLLSGKYDRNNAILTIHPGARWY